MYMKYSRNHAIRPKYILKAILRYRERPKDESRAEKLLRRETKTRRDQNFSRPEARK